MHLQTIYETYKNSMKRFLESILWLIKVHVSALAVFFIYRLVEFIALHGLVTKAAASVLPAFLRGVWFDNVVACYIMIVPLTVVLVSAMFGYYRKWLRRSVTVWFAVLYAVAFIPSAANTPYFAYFFKNINSSIFGWFGYAATTAGMLVEEKSYWLYIILYLFSLLRS